MKSTKSAVVITPPTHLCSQIQDIRRKHDKAFDRWMPHINLLYPFVEDKGTEFSQASKRFCQQLLDFRAFKVALTKESLGHFNHGKNCTVFVKPQTIQEEKKKPPVSVEKKKKKPVKEPRSKQTQRPSSKPAKPAIGQPPQSSTPSTVGIDALRHAYWLPENTKDLEVKEKPLKAGWENLQYAFWDVEYSLKKSANDLQGLFLISADAVAHGVHPKPEVYYAAEKDDTEDSNGDDTESDTSDAEDKTDKTGWINDGSGGQENQTRDQVICLQKVLEECYPQCSDLRDKSTEGYQPHLTLGQMNSTNVEKFKADLAQTWVDIEFDVEQVHLISRRGLTDPFVIKNSVPLGGLCM